MKVDKGVCTSNDAYFEGNTAANELNSIIKFETVFTTLVENKILAIKRDCEQHDCNKKNRVTLKNILTRKPSGNQQKESVECDVESKKKSRKNFFLRHKNKKSSDIDIEKGARRDDEPNKVSPSNVAESVKVEVQSDKATTNDLGLGTIDDKPPETLDSQPNEQLATSGNVFISSDDASFNDGQQNCDKLLVKTRTENAQLPLSTNNSSNVCSNKTIKESSPPLASNNNEHDESLATTIDISLQQSSVVAQVKATAINIDKSDIAVCDDVVSSQNTSDIEFSLVSESICELPLNVRKKTSINSDPIVKKPAHFLSPPLGREIKVSERKAISCQSTPLFGRHQKGQLKSESGEIKKVLTFQKELPKKVCEPKTIEKQKSQTIVIAPTSTTTTTTLAKPVSTISGPVETVHVSRKSQKHSKYRDVSLEYEITYDNDENQSPRGFISSFNQLTSQTPPVAVISTHPKKQSCHRSKAQSKNGKNQQEAYEKSSKYYEIELELDDLAIDEDNKRKRKRSECESSKEKRAEM